MLRELSLEHVAEEVVVPVPAATMVEPDEEQVRLLHGLELARRALAPQNRVTEWGAHPLEHRGSREEPPAGRGQPRQVLAAQVIGDVLVVPGETREVDRLAGLVALFLAPDRRELEPRGPALGPVRELGHLDLVQHDV